MALRLVYLTLARVLSWLALIARSNATKVWVPGTVSRALTSASAANRPGGHRSQPGIRHEVLDRILIFNQAARGCRTTTEIRDVRRCDPPGRLIHEYQQVT